MVRKFDLFEKLCEATKKEIDRKNSSLVGSVSYGYERFVEGIGQYINVSCDIRDVGYFADKILYESRAEVEREAIPNLINNIQSQMHPYPVVLAVGSKDMQSFDVESALQAHII